LKILLTVHQFLPEYCAGTEILTFDTAKELQRLGHETVICTGFPASAQLQESQRFDSYTYDGVRVERFHHAHVLMGDQTNVMEAEYNNLFFARHFHDLIGKYRPDLVHFFHLGRLSASAIDVCAELRVPMVLTATDFWFVCPTSQLRLPDNSMCEGPDRFAVNCLRHVVKLNQPARVNAKLDKIPDWAASAMIWAIGKGMFSNQGFAPNVRAVTKRPSFLRQRINKLDRVLVPTRLMERILAKNGLDLRLITYLPYGISMGHISPSSMRKKKQGTEPLSVGFIGTLYEHKGAHVLIKAVRSLPTAIPVELKVYGNLEEFPDYVSELKRVAFGDPRILFCGTFPNAEIGQIFSNLDVLVVPSIWYENTPLVIYSAQAAGCPVIASNLGGMAEAVEHEENGLLFPPGDVDGLSKTIARLVADRSLLFRLTSRARKPKSIPLYVAELLTIYQQILSAYPSRYAAKAITAGSPTSGGSPRHLNEWS
jgi:glycosyltransferase involved in cell wall biosynthesis